VYVISPDPSVPSVAVALRKEGTVCVWGTRDDGALGGGDGKPAGPYDNLPVLAVARRQRIDV